MRHAHAVARRYATVRCYAVVKAYSQTGRHTASRRSTSRVVKEGRLSHNKARHMSHVTLRHPRLYHERPGMLADGHDHRLVRVQLDER